MYLLMAMELDPDFFTYDSSYDPTNIFVPTCLSEMWLEVGDLALDFVTVK